MTKELALPPEDPRIPTTAKNLAAGAAGTEEADDPPMQRLTGEPALVVVEEPKRDINAACAAQGARSRYGASAAENSPGKPGFSARYRRSGRPGNRKLERDHTRPCFDAGDGRIAAPGKTKLGLEAPALEPRLSSLRPSATGSPHGRERLFPTGCSNRRAPARREKLGGACRFPGKERHGVLDTRERTSGGNGVRIHHFFPGIAIAFGAGAAPILARREGGEVRIGLPFGVGAGLTLDEVDLLLERANPYWRGETLAFVQSGVAAVAAAVLARASITEELRS